MSRRVLGGPGAQTWRLGEWIQTGPRPRRALPEVALHAVGAAVRRADGLVSAHSPGRGASVRGQLGLCPALLTPPSLPVPRPVRLRLGCLPPTPAHPRAGVKWPGRVNPMHCEPGCSSCVLPDPAGPFAVLRMTLRKAVIYCPLDIW